MHSLRCRVLERNSKKDPVTIFFTNSTTVGLKVGLTDLRSPWNQNFAQISIFTRFPIFPVFPWCFPPFSQNVLDFGHAPRQRFRALRWPQSSNCGSPGRCRKRRSSKPFVQVGKKPWCKNWWGKTHGHFMFFPPIQR